MSPHRLAVAFLAGSAGLWLAAAAATVATAGLPAEANGPVLALFAPGTDESEAVSRIVAAGGVPGEAWAGLGWTAWSSQRGFAGRLREAGAWLVVRPIGAVRTAWICGG